MWERLFARLGKDKNYSLKKKKVMKHELSLHMIANWYIYFSEKSLETIKCCHRCYIKNNVLFTTFRAITQIMSSIHADTYMYINILRNTRDLSLGITSKSNMGEN